MLPEPYIPPDLSGKAGEPSKPPPPMNVVIQVVGSRGDVQPFVALGKVLKDRYHHRVRLATHEVFRSFVQDNGLEFFCIGGDPSELMAFMVRNPGLMPGFDTLRTGDVGKRRKEIFTMVRGCWRSCIEVGDGTGLEASDKNIPELFGGADNNAPIDEGVRPFVADAIIANPPSFAHIHVAEKMGIPLHLMFTMPWSPTQAFPHPLANITSTNTGDSITNFISYALVDMLTWQGLGDVINRFRQTDLGLEPIGLSWAPGLLSRLKVPYTYCWSPALIPKPRDWQAFINISGFFFLPLGTNYTPDPALAEFLAAGPPPVYIGFGSVVVDDPNGMTNLIFEAVKKSGQRALVSKGWGGFGSDDLQIPENVHMLGNVPHDWLFKHVSAVVHHGGAGTTAAGVAAGKPTIIVPFFGDQPFWGSMIARAGAGPEPIHHKSLTADRLASAITHALQPGCVEKAKEMSEKIAREEGSENGARSFHKQLDLDQMRCHLCPDRPAAWQLKGSKIRLSAFAAATLGAAGVLEYHHLKLYRPTEWDTEGEPWDPITGSSLALIETMGSMAMGVADMPVQALKALRIHPDASKGKAPKDKSKGKGKEKVAEASPRHSEEHTAETARTASQELRAAPLSSDSSVNLPIVVEDDEGYGSERGLTASDARIDSRHDSQVGVPTTSSVDSTQGHNVGEPVSATAQGSEANSLGGSHQRIPSSSLAETVDESSRTSGSPRPDSRTSEGTRERASSSASHGKKSFSMPTRADLEATVGAGKGAWRITSAIGKSPMDFSMGLARGFHNAPKLYGDTTVRKPDKITGIGSGLKAAGKGFALGLSDGITGLVTQPYEGAKKEGPVGFLKGVGKGIGGIALKPQAAAFGIPAYTMKGIYKEMQSMFGPSVSNYILAARTAQGYDEFRRGSPDEHARVLQRFKALKRFLKYKKVLSEELDMIQTDFWANYKAPPERQESQPAHGRSSETVLPSVASQTSVSQEMSPRAELSASPMPEAGMVDHHDRTELPPDYRQSVDLHNAFERSLSEKETHHLAEHAEYEEAIRRSVAETSRGDPDEDAQIERAIRASFAELEERRGQGADEEEMEAAMRASLEQANRGLAAGGDEEDEELQKILEQSRQDHEKTSAEEDEARREEEIVLKHVMRQSALENEYLQRKGGQSSASGL